MILEDDRHSLIFTDERTQLMALGTRLWLHQMFTRDFIGYKLHFWHLGNIACKWCSFLILLSLSFVMEIREWLSVQFQGHTERWERDLSRSRASCLKHPLTSRFSVQPSPNPFPHTPFPHTPFTHTPFHKPQNLKGSSGGLVRQTHPTWFQKWTTWQSKITVACCLGKLCLAKDGHNPVSVHLKSWCSSCDSLLWHLRQKSALCLFVAITLFINLLPVFTKLCWSMISWRYWPDMVWDVLILDWSHIHSFNKFC